MSEKHPAITDIKPFIGASDYAASRAFYLALGWRLNYDSETLCVMELGNHRFYLQDYYVKQWCDNSMLHVAVADVDAWHQHVSEVFASHPMPKGCRVSGPPVEEDYARVFHVWDPAGVLLHFAQLNN